MEEPTNLQKVTAAAAVLALVFSFLAWRNAAAARERADAAVAAASSASVPDATYAVSELTAALVEAGVIQDPETRWLRELSPEEAAENLCGLLLQPVTNDEPRDDEPATDATEDPSSGASARVWLAPTDASEAQRTYEALMPGRPWDLPDLVGGIEEAQLLVGVLERDDLTDALARIADAWLDAVPGPDDDPLDAIDGAFEPIETDPDVRALRTWVGENCLD